MDSNTNILKQYFLDIVEGLRLDADSKGQKAPISQLRFEADELGGKLYAPHYFKYLLYGRGPGGAPPPDVMTAWAENSPDILTRARQVYQNITAQQLGFLVGRKIAREGTDIYTGKRQGIDLLGVMEEAMPDFLKDLAKNEALKVATGLQSAVDKIALEQ